MVDAIADGEGLIGTTELVRRTGLSRRAIHGLVAEKKLPAFQFQKKLFFRWTEVCQAMDKARTVAQS